MCCLSNLKLANMNIHYFRYPFSYFLEKQDEQGCKSIVFWGSVPHLWVDQLGCEDTANTAEMLDGLRIKVEAYAARPYNYSLFAPKGSLQRKCTESYYRHCINAAQMLGTNRICIDLWGALRDIDAEVQYENCAEMLKELCEYAKESDCTIIVGNVPFANSAMMNTLSEVKRLWGDVHTDNCGISLDICTAMENGEDIKAWQDTFGDRLTMVYLADGDGAGAGYPLGSGCYPIAEILNILEERKYRGMVAIKMDREKNELDPVGADRVNFEYLKKAINAKFAI